MRDLQSLRALTQSEVGEEFGFLCTERCIWDKGSVLPYNHQSNVLFFSVPTTATHTHKHTLQTLMTHGR